LRQEAGEIKTKRYLKNLFLDRMKNEEVKSIHASHNNHTILLQPNTFMLFITAAEKNIIEYRVFLIVSDHASMPLS